MRKLIFVGVATFLALFLFLAGPLPAQDEIIVKMIEPISDGEVKALFAKYPEDAQIHLGSAYLRIDIYPFEFKPASSLLEEAREKAIKLAPEYKKIFLIQDLKNTGYLICYEETLKKLRVEPAKVKEDLRKSEELVRIDPGNAWPHYLLAVHYLNKGEKEKWLKEVDEALSKERLDDYETERLQAIFRVIDEANPRFKAVNKLNYWASTLLPLLGPARNSARELVKIGKQFEEKGEKDRALEYYRKAERIAQQILLKKPDFLITRLVSIAIRKIAYEEMARFYEEEGQAIEAAALREQLDLMDVWVEEAKRTHSKIEVLFSPLPWLVHGASFISIDTVDMEEIQPEKREEIKRKFEQLKNQIWDLFSSPLYTNTVDAYIQIQFSEGEINARETLPELDKFPIAKELERLRKEAESLNQAMLQARLPEKLPERTCKYNLKQIGLACIMYACDYDDVFPPNLEVLGKRGYIEEKLFPKWMKCPASGDEYVYIGAGKSTRKVKRPDLTIIAYDKKPVHNNGRNAIFMDGHCEWMSEEKFQKRLAEQKEK